MKKLFSFCALVCLILGGCGHFSSDGWKVAVDPTWEPLDFGPQQSFVNGFVSEFLLAFSKYNRIELVKFETNQSDLFEGLKKGSYDAVLTSIPPYNYNLAEYDFSANFLDIGPVMVAQKGSSYKKLSDFNGQLVGLVEGDSTCLELLQPFSAILPRIYRSLPLMLEAVANGEIQGALYARIPVVSYIKDLYQNQLVIVAGPLNDAGLHLITLKGKEVGGMRLFEATLKQFKKKKQLSELQQKWLLW